MERETGFEPATSTLAIESSPLISLIFWVSARYNPAYIGIILNFLHPSCTLGTGGYLNRPDQKCPGESECD